ncbi:LPXTG cell wall anchor domain-containing protein, partial [Streptococcus dentapri]
DNDGILDVDDKNPKVADSSAPEINPSPSMRAESDSLSVSVAELKAETPIPKTRSDVKTLPKTGDSDFGFLTSLGLLLTAFGIFGLRKKDDSEK